MDDLVDILRSKGVAFRVLATGSPDDTAARDHFETAIPWRVAAHVDWTRATLRGGATLTDYDQTTAALTEALNAAEQAGAGPGDRVHVHPENGADPTLEMDFNGLRATLREIADDGLFWVYLPERRFCIEYRHHGALDFGCFPAG
ncbi:MAG: hypothetical protein HKO95_05005 [Rhodobacteraceae bacterium]|nr:hypothetical protein [Paracoccaceae bacterium]